MEWDTERAGTLYASAAPITSKRLATSESFDNAISLDLKGCDKVLELMMGWGDSAVILVALYSSASTRAHG